MITPAKTNYITYRIVLVDPSSRCVLGLGSGESCVVRIDVPARSRHVRYLQSVLNNQFNVPAIVVDYLSVRECSACVLAERLDKGPADVHSAVEWPIDLSSDECMRLEGLLNSCANSVSHIGLADRVRSWIESQIGEDLETKPEIEQHAAGSGFALLRFVTQNAGAYWLKASAGPNAHERNLTRCLASLCSSSLPRFVAEHPEWNAWLMKEDGNTVPALSEEPDLVLQRLGQATLSLASLQRASIGKESELLEAGAFDQRLQILSENVDLLLSDVARALVDAGSISDLSTWPNRISEIRRTFDRVVRRLEHLEIPATILHGDLNLGNLAFSKNGSQFLDWSEGYIGCPFISFEHLLRLRPHTEASGRSAVGARLKEIYQHAMADILDEEQIEAGFACSPFLAAVSTLYGRGQRLGKGEAPSFHRLRFMRTMLHHIESAARSMTLQRALQASRGWS